ncbi:hypothetical protein GCM10020255_007150 [Rhodococcus baikonurensis]
MRKEVGHDFVSDEGVECDVFEPVQADRDVRFGDSPCHCGETDVARKVQSQMRIVDCECASAAFSALTKIDQPVDEFFVGVEDVGTLLDTSTRVHDQHAGACEDNIFDLGVVYEDLKGPSPKMVL